MQTKSYTKSVYEKVYEAVEKYGMLENAASVLAAFSGGADSTALLYLLSERYSRLKIYAIHVNHHIRGEEAYRDQHFCEDFCRSRNIELFVRDANVPELARESGKSLEEAAREVRYGIFDRIVSEYNIDRIATAHNSGDNLETSLFNFIRGAGIKGLTGISPVRGNIIRPLILCSKSEIVGYCNENNLSYVTDSTNNDTDYTRNFLRHEVIPKLKKLNPSAEISCARECELLRRDEEYISLKASETFDTDTCRELSELPDSLLSRNIIHAYEKIAPAGRSLSFGHIDDIMRLVRCGSEHQSLSLPGKVRAVIGGGRLTFISEYQQSDSEYEDHVVISHEELCEKDIKELKNIYKLSIHKTVDSAKIIGSPFVRCRLSGDTYQMGGHTKIVRKLLSEKKIPLNERDRIPFFCDDNGIFWIPGFEPRDDVKVKPDNFNSELLHVYYFKRIGE